MGPDTKGNDIRKLQLTINGHPVVYGADGNIPTVQICGDDKNASAGNFDAVNLGVLSITIKFPKELRCTSRKRFVKLLMGHGWKRNAANTMAELVQEWKESYQYLFDVMWADGYLKFMAGRRDDQ